MILAFGSGEKFGYIVVAEAFDQAHRPGNCPVGFGRRRFQHLLQPDPQSIVHHLFKRFPQARSTLPRFGRNIRVEGESRAHVGIMMSSL